jgi:hypothetical protein
MRVGSHPDKSNTEMNVQEFYHRIIVIVYIPQNDGYFKDSFKILKSSLKTLQATIHTKAAITVINNGCELEVTNFLRELAVNKQLDKLVEYPVNKGKIDPLLAEVRASYETLITISDFDVLFKKNWITDVESIFQAIPSCGMVGHFPDPKKYKGYNATTLLSGLFRNRLKLEKQDFNQELAVFAESINTTFEDYAQDEILTYTKKGVKAVVGAHHFSATMHKGYLKEVSLEPSNQKMAGNSEYHYVDKPVDKLGCLRLSPRYPVVYHMANTWEDWMEEEIQESLTAENVKVADINKELKTSKISKIPYALRIKLESLFFRTNLEKVVRKYFF